MCVCVGGWGVQEADPGLQRYEIWRDAPGMCDLTSVLSVSLSEGRRRCFGSTAASSGV